MRNKFLAGCCTALILCALLVGSFPGYSQTFIKRIIGVQDIYFAVGGTGAVETFTHITQDGYTLTLNKLDAAYLKFRTLLWGAARSVDSIVPRLEYEIWVGDPNYPTFAAAVATLNSAGTACTLRLPVGNHAVSANLTANSNIRIIPENGALFSIATTKTLTVNGVMEAGRYRIFSLTGTGAVAGLKTAFPEWFGTGAAALQSCMNACQTTLLNDGTVYTYSGAGLYPPLNHTIASWGPGAVLYRSDAGGGLYPFNYVTLRNITLRGAGGAYVAGADGIVILYNNGSWVSPGGVVGRDQTDMAKWRGAHLTLDNVIMEDWPANGVEAGPYSKILNVTVQNCTNEGMLIQGDRVSILNPTVLNCGGWGIDINASHVQVLGGLIFNCGDFSVWDKDCGGVLISSHTQAVGAVGNEIIGTTIDTSDCYGVVVLAPTGSDYVLTDTILSGLTIKNVNVASDDVNAGAISVVDDSTSGGKVVNTQIMGVVVDTTGIGHGITLLRTTRASINGYNINNPFDVGIYAYTDVTAYPGSANTNLSIENGICRGYLSAAVKATNATDFQISGYDFIKTNAAASVSGIRLENVIGFNIGKGIIGLDTTYGYGVYTTGSSGKGQISGAIIKNTLAALYYDATGDYVNITGNNLSTNNTAKLARSGTKTYVVQANNLGIPVPEYANNGAAVAGGLAIGEIYRITGTDPLAVVH